MNALALKAITSMPVEPLHDANDERVAPYRRVRDADLLAWPDAPHGLFLAESPSVIEAAVASGACPRSVLVDESFVVGRASSAQGSPVVQSIESVMRAWPECPVLSCPRFVFERITGYHIVRSAIAAFERPEPMSPEALLAGARRVAVLEDVGNYANIGSAFRAAHAFGIDAVLVTPSCHDPLFRRAARTSRGAVLRVPWARIGTVREWASEGVPLLHRAGFKVAALALEDRSLPLDDVRLASCEKLAMVLGTEGAGLLRSTIAQCDFTVRIPMSHGVDSLNVAVASAVAFWELRVRC